MNAADLEAPSSRSVSNEKDTSIGSDGASRRVVIGSLMVALLLSALDNTIVGTAMPTIAGQFNAFGLYAWVSTSYAVTSTIATLLLGKLSDLYGRRRLLLFTIALFLFASLLCGAAQSMPQLIAARALQGIGGGGIWGLTFATVGDIVPPRERGKYFGLFSSMWGIAAVLGPLVGGVIVDNASWRWIFLVNLPLGVVAFALLARVLRVPPPTRRPVVDVMGAVLLTVCVAAFMLSLEQGQERGWTSGPIVGGFSLAAVAFALFIRQERRAPEPILPLRLFRNPHLRTSYLLGFLIGPAMYTTGLFFGLFFQSVRFMSPTVAGLAGVPMMIGMVSGSTVSGRIITKLGRYRMLPRIGFLMCAAGGLSAFFLTSSTSYAVIAPIMFLTGLGTGIAMPTMSIVAQNSADPKDLGISSAVQNFMRSAGAAIAIACLSVYFNHHVKSELDRQAEGGRSLFALIRKPSEIERLPRDTRNAITHAIAGASGRVVMISALVVLVGWFLTFWVKDQPLRTTSGLEARATE